MKEAVNVGTVIGPKLDSHIVTTAHKATGKI
jgi:hypothetical protein